MQTGDTFFIIQTPPECIGNRSRLFENLFQHEMIEAAFFDSIQRPFNLLDIWRDSDFIDGGDFEIIGGNVRNLALLQVDHLTGMPDESGNIRGHKIFSMTASDNQRRPRTRDHNFAWMISRDNRNPVSALDEYKGCPHSLEQVTFIILLDQVRQDFCIGFGTELMPIFF